jgi:integrase
MKSGSKNRTPTTQNLTVKRRYLTEREVERLMDCARKYGRYGHRDATMMLVAYRHGLRASEVCDLQWQQIELSEGRLHVHRVKNGIPSVHPIRVTRCGRCASYGAITRETPTYSFPSAAGQSALSVSTGSSSVSGRPPR